MPTDWERRLEAIEHERQRQDEEWKVAKAALERLGDGTSPASPERGPKLDVNLLVPDEFLRRLDEVCLAGSLPPTNGAVRA
jgi:hypothetical protein